MIMMIIQLPFTKHSYRNMKFQALPNSLNNERKVDILWSYRLTSTRQPLIGQARHTFYISMIEVHPGQSSIVYLPMIDIISVPVLVLPITKCIFDVSNNTFLSPATNDV